MRPVRATRATDRSPSSENRAPTGGAEPKPPTVTIASSSKRTTWAPSAPNRRTASSATRAMTESSGAACATASAARRSAACSSAAAALAAAASRSRSWSRRCAVASRAVRATSVADSRTTSRSTHSAGPPATPARPWSRRGSPSASVCAHIRASGSATTAGIVSRSRRPTADPSSSGARAFWATTTKSAPSAEGVTARSTTIASRLAASAAAKRASPVPDVSIRLLPRAT